MPRAFTLPATENDFYRIFVIPIPLKAKRYVKAWAFRPGHEGRGSESARHHLAQQLARL